MLSTQKKRGVIMLFSSPIFLFGFLPAVLIFYFLAADNYKNIVLLLFSLLFYAWGEPRFVVIMLFSIALNYFSALAIDSYRKNNRPKAQKTALVLSVAINLGILFYFKYINFFIGNINYLLSKVTSTAIPLVDAVMPIGISFFTFQSMSYVIDVYRQDAKVQENILNVGLYVSLFPQLIAGPIVRYVDVAKEVNNRHTTFEGFVGGLRRFIVGLGKKTLIANTVALAADNIFTLRSQSLSTPVAWIGLLCYSLQIYFDFSGYSDMAIGLGKMFGFHFHENFNYPYISRSVSEFWRRWHISLSTWFRDYLYIPLGGNRKGTKRTYLNLFIVFFVTGFWHGASWNFIVWGLFHGFFQIIERLGIFDKLLTTLRLPKDSPLRRLLGHLVTLFVVLIGWVFFRADNLGKALRYLGRLFAITSPENVLYSPTYFLTTKVLIAVVFGVFFSMPIYQKIVDYKNSKPKHPWSALQVLEDISLVVVFLLCLISIASSSYNPFIYFRF